MKTRRWLALVFVPLVLVGCGRILEKLRARRDAGAAVATSDDGGLDLHVGSNEDPDPLAGLGGLAALEDDAGCPRPIHPGYCRRRCRGLPERRANGHARRVWPSAAYAFGTCGTYEVFAERTPDGGGIVEYYDPKTNQLVGAVDDRLKACDSFGAIPKCTPKLHWSDAGVGHRGGLGAPNPGPDDEE